MRGSRSCRSRRRWHAAALAGAIAIVCPVGALRAADPERTFSQFVRDRWDTARGYTAGQVYAISQTRDGYLWIAAEKGIVRFDGIRFRLFQSVLPTSSTDTAALSLAPDAEGGLWTWLRRAALLRFHNGGFDNALRVAGPPQPRVGAMAVGTEGAILIADARLGLLRSHAGRVDTLLAADSLPRPFVTAVAQTTGGDIWLGTPDSGLVRVQQGRATPVATPSLKQRINCLVSNAGDGLWIGTDSGIYRYDSGVVTPAMLPSGTDRVQTLAMIRDRDHNVWAGTSEGLVRITSGGAVTLDRRGTMSAITALFEDREGNLWVGDTAGIERWREGAWVFHGSVDPVMAGSIGPVLSDAAGGVWFAPAGGGLYRLGERGLESVTALRDEVVYSIAEDAGGAVLVGRQRGGMTRVRAQGRTFVTDTFTEGHGLAQNQVFAVHRTRDGAVWAGTLSRGASHMKNRVFTTYTTADGLVSNTVTAILEAADGAVWFGTPNGVSVKSGDGWRRYASSDGLPSSDVNTLFQDSRGVMWIGTAAGLAVIFEGRVQSADVPELRGSILGIAEDGGGALWVAATDRVLRVNRDRLLRRTLSAADLRVFDTADGLVDAEGLKRHRVLTSDPRGRLWLATNRGLAMADGRRMGGAPVAALVQIEEMTADGTPVVRADATIPPRTARITFAFVALSLSVPDRVRYRYRLDGFDRDWSEPVSDRQAVFTNLGPGAYRFRVIASNSEGVWNSGEAALPFTIAPAWSQMPSVWVMVGLLATAVAWASYRMRLRIVERHRQEIAALNERLMKAQEQERIRIAGELHDGVMQEMLAVTMLLGTAKRKMPDGSDAMITIDKAQQKLVQAGTDIRQLSHDLHPPLLQEAGLPKAVRAYCEQFSAAAGVPVACEADETVEELSRGAALALFRVVQEALGNAAKHARPSRIIVRLSRNDGMVSLVVSDDGAGFSRARLSGEGGLGLVMMRERATQLGGTFEFDSAPGHGTTLRVTIPFR